MGHSLVLISNVSSVGFGVSDHLVKVTSSVAKAGMMKEVLLK